MPVDNVQRFESLCNDAVYLQALADKENLDFDEINGLTDVVRAGITEVMNGFPVCVTGGLVEVVAINTDFEEARVFVPNQDTTGAYWGLNWRQEVIKYPDSSQETTWRLCHMIGTQELTYVDAAGDIIKRIPTSNITVENSFIDLLSPLGSHDYRQLALDGACLGIDQIALDDIELYEKAERIAKFFRIDGANQGSAELAKRIRQRISYLNELMLFDGCIVSSPIGLSRNDNDTMMLKASENIFATIHYMSTDEAVSSDGELLPGTSCLSYETVLPDFGHVSIPHIPGVTKVYGIV